MATDGRTVYGNPRRCPLSRHLQRFRTSRMANVDFHRRIGPPMLAALLANEEAVERLGEVGDLVVGCTSAEELRRRGRGLFNSGS